MTATLILPSKSDCPHKAAVFRLSLCAGVLRHPLTLSCKTRLYLYLQRDLVRYLPLSSLELCSRWPHPLAKALGISVRIVSTVKVLTVLVWTITLQVLRCVSARKWYLTFSKSSPQLERIHFCISAQWPNLSIRLIVRTKPLSFDALFVPVCPDTRPRFHTGTDYIFTPGQSR